MRVAAYCRVSTDKADQMNSLDAQKKFFDAYTEKNGHTLVGLYADEGISGTKIKNRREFLRLMDDAARGLFDMVVVKDISRFARNTVDLLNSTRKLKALGIETLFLTANMTILGHSEFVLTIFGALAQEESANTSKRVKFGKRMNAEKGRVPNLVYGYDKTPGDYFHLAVNETEAAVVRRIFALYTEEGMSTGGIASLLNGEGLRTKRGCAWSGNAVARILSNELYAGTVVNGREETRDFLTGARRAKEKDEWIVTPRPELCIVPPAVFEKARDIREGRRQMRVNEGRRASCRHLFSSLIRCGECGHSFKRLAYTYRNTHVRWVCGGRNAKGAASCLNRTAIDEDALVDSLDAYFGGIVQSKKRMMERAAAELARTYGTESFGEERRKTLQKLEKLEAARQRTLDLFADGCIGREELKKRLARIGADRAAAEEAQRHLSGEESGGAPEQNARGLLQPPEESFVRGLANAGLARIVKRIDVDKEARVRVFLRAFGEGAGREAFPFCDDGT